MQDTIRSFTDILGSYVSMIIHTIKSKLLAATSTLSALTGLGEHTILMVLSTAVIAVIIGFFLIKKLRSAKPIDEHTPVPGSNEITETPSDMTDVHEPVLLSPIPAPSDVNASQDETTTGLMGNIRNGLAKTRKALSSRVDRLFSTGSKLDDHMLEELEEILITSDVGVETSMRLISTLSAQSSGISSADDLKQIIKQEIFKIIDGPRKNMTTSTHKPHVIMVVGVNGVGKTTTIGKLASRFVGEGKKVLIVAADTFRAAASEQLAVWAERSGADIVRHKDNSDPAAVAFDGIEAALARDVDIVMIDTAGRLHTKINLMEELKKIKRTVNAKIPDAPHDTLMVLDATTGQNALQQAKLFNEAIGITTIALTKLDGTAKGGIVIGISHTLNIPLSYVGVGEQIKDLQDFDPKEFADALF